MAQAAHATRCRAGQSWEWDGVHFDVLWPREPDYARALKTNAMSCVLRISSGADGSLRGPRSVLLTGDIEREQEAALVAAAPQALRSDVLIVPHHGSRTSSSSPFLEAVAPRIAVFQAGYRNRFGHPAAEVMARYVALGVDVHVSPDCGAWRWDAGAEPQGACYRDLVRRYWHHRGASGEHEIEPLVDVIDESGRP
jgi:competence protein ComEC